MKLRSILAIAASCRKVTQPRLSDFLRGRVGKFSLDAAGNAYCSRRPRSVFGNHIGRVIAIVLKRTGPAVHPEP